MRSNYKVKRCWKCDEGLATYLVWNLSATYSQDNYWAIEVFDKSVSDGYGIACATPWQPKHNFTVYTAHHSNHGWRCGFMSKLVKYRHKTIKQLFFLYIKINMKQSMKRMMNYCNDMINLVSVCVLACLCTLLWVDLFSSQIYNLDRAISKQI